MKVMSIFGTRPEMIKMWSTLKMLDELNFDHIMVSLLETAEEDLFNEALLLSRRTESNEGSLVPGRKG